MMPGSAVLAPVVALPAGAVVSVSDLSSGERSVALYASDMPDRFRSRRGDDAQVTAWIVQGAERLGLDELYRWAAYAKGYRLLWMAGVNTPEQDAAHAARFPRASRLDRAERAAVVTVLRTSVSRAAVARSRRPLVEGRCVCAGTGWLASVFDPDDPTTYYRVNCPGHNPDGRDMPVLPVAGEVAA